MPKPADTPGGRPDETPGRGLGRDRPLDEDTGRKRHPHGQPPGQAGRPPKPERPDEDGDGGTGTDGSQPD